MFFLEKQMPSYAHIGVYFYFLAPFCGYLRLRIRNVARVKNTLRESFTRPKKKKWLSRPCLYRALAITLMGSQKPFFH